MANPLKKMRGQDRINTLPEELILEIFGYLVSKPNRDSISLVCKKWLNLERLTRETIRIGASGSPDTLVNLLSQRFVNVRNVFIDERLSISVPDHYVSFFFFLIDRVLLFGNLCGFKMIF